MAGPSSRAGHLDGKSICGDTQCTSKSRRGKDFSPRNQRIARLFMLGNSTEGGISGTSGEMSVRQ